MSATRAIVLDDFDVRAVLDGRKTAHRLLAEVEPPAGGLLAPTARVPFRPGEDLWVREVWRPVDRHTPAQRSPQIRYRSDQRSREVFDLPHGYRWPDQVFRGDGWCPAVWMPQWMSRLRLRVEGVRLAQLQDLSEEEARAEGMLDVYPLRARYRWASRDETQLYQSAREAFRAGWDFANPERDWEANPSVWVVTWSVQGVLS